MIEEVIEAVRSGRFLEPEIELDLSRLGLDQVVLDHVGIAVRSIAETTRTCERLGLSIAFIETVASEGVQVAMVPVGASRIELLEALDPETVVGRFLARHGEGMHHLALRARGISSLFARLRSQGVRLATSEPRIGAGGHSCFFVHPTETGGVLVEFVEDKSEGASECGCC